MCNGGIVNMFNPTIWHCDSEVAKPPQLYRKTQQAITFKVKYALFQLAYITEYFRFAIFKVTNRENGV